MRSYLFVAYAAVTLLGGCTAELHQNTPAEKTEQASLITVTGTEASAGPVIKSSESMEINRLIGLLNNDDWQVREDSTKAIRIIFEGIGRESLDIIRAEIRSAVSLEVKVRLEAIQDDLEHVFNNMLENPSFEEEFTGWKYVDNWNGSKIQLIQAEKGSVPDGDFFIEMWHDPARGAQYGSSSWSACGQDISSIVKPDTSYFVSFWYCTTDHYGFRIATADSQLVMHSTAIASVSEPVADGKWHKVTGTFSRTADQLSNEPYLTLYYDYCAPGTVWFDSVTMVRLTNTGDATNNRK